MRYNVHGIDKETKESFDTIINFEYTYIPQDQRQNFNKALNTIARNIGLLAGMADSLKMRVASLEDDLNDRG